MLFRRKVVEQESLYPPEGINPIQVGAVIDGRIDDRDIIAGFYYLAQQGYMDIVEYELKHFEFIAKNKPENESDDIQMLYKAIFGRKSRVKLVDISNSLIKAIPKIEMLSVNIIRQNFKGQELADLTGKMLGFRKTVFNTKGKDAKSVLEQDPDYIFKIVPYAYSFAITAKLASNFNLITAPAPSWYKPYGVDDNYEFDILVYNSMLRNLPEELRTLVFEDLALRQRIGL